MQISPRYIRSTGIPRSLLIDKNFKIVSMAAPLPSEAAAIKEIDKLL